MTDTIEQLKELGEWYGKLYVPFDEVEDYVFKLKFDFEQRLANAVNYAYDEGYLNGVER